MVAAGGRIFARGLPRNSYSGGWPAFPTSLYELKTDGSNQGRKIFDIEGNRETGSNFRNLFADLTRARIGYLTYENDKLYLYLRETSQGALLRRVDMSRTTLDCLVTNIGFLPDGQQAFFTADTGDDDATSKSSFGRVGTYVMKTDGSTPVRTARTANLIAPLSGGRNLYSGRPPLSFLYRTGPTSKARRDYATSATGVLDAAGGRVRARVLRARAAFRDCFGASERQRRPRRARRAQFEQTPARGVDPSSLGRGRE
jgi:hypothetical protein